MLEQFVDYVGVNGHLNSLGSLDVPSNDHLHKPFYTLAQGDLDIIQQKLKERKTLIDADVRSLPRKLRTFNLPIALDATNALDDMRIAQDLLDEVEELLGVGLVALLADAGGGKTQMAAQLSAPQTERPAGIFLQGRNLHRGQTLDDLSRHFVINGNPLTSMESLVASLDAAGKRAKCRLPILIDGLNEAENPMDWKPALASLGEIIKKYPNVLILTTLRTGERRRDEHALRHESQTNDRESFAVMALPEGMRKIECEGFGGDVDEAIDKYFSYFKINPGDAEIPVDLLQHPLTLRIFCEVTNPERKNEIKINHFPSSISALFEKYMANACQRISEMPNLSQRYSAADVDVAIYKFGCVLWESRQREVGETFFREVVSDTSRHWDSSIVNLLAQEGVIFKNPGTEPGTFVVTPTYDALGGYIIANSLLRKYARDITFDWLTYPETTANFFGDDSHELAFDIFISLVALTPRRISGKQIWKDAPLPFRKIALSYTTTIEPEYIDRDTVAALLTLIRDSQKQRIQLFPRLMEIRGVASHPLNSEFLDSALRSMTVSDRDLSWTEWVRGTRAERFNDLLSMEMKWKENFDIRTASDRLRAKWVMWLLTSTDRELRDIATRALYWFGRGAPGDLFKECLLALEINDPYVPERMLSASYGVAMAKCIDIHDQIFVSTTLSDFARGLYNAMFSDDAPFSTTHALIREYGQRIIEISSLHNPSLFSSEEFKRSAPPFLDGGIREWGVSDILREREKNGFDSPFRMDFENYTIGSLVPGRSNYDYGHEGYRSVRAQILWRIEQLGWSSEHFKDLDKLIANEQHWPRSGGDAKKIDRYGKKYSWIAFFEMSGLLHDQGAVENWRERTSTVDIDPSFPERVTKGRIILADFLGDSDIETKEWIARGSLPDVSPYLRMVELQKEKGPWIALDGFFTQQDETRGRKIFCFIRSFLISTSDVSFFVASLSKQDLGGRWLPEKPEVVYTFAGEMPWCETFPGNGLSEFSFVVKEEPVKVLKNQQVLYLDGKKWGGSRVDLIRRRLFGKNIEFDVDQKQMTDEDIARIEVREESVEVEELRKEYVEFKAHIPVASFGWEGYQSTSSDAGHATTLSKEIALDMGLIGQPQTFDLFTKAGIKATFCEGVKRFV